VSCQQQLQLAPAGGPHGECQPDRRRLTAGCLGYLSCSTAACCLYCLAGEGGTLGDSKPEQQRGSAAGHTLDELDRMIASVTVKQGSEYRCEDTRAHGQTLWMDLRSRVYQHTSTSRSQQCEIIAWRYLPLDGREPAPVRACLPAFE